MLVCLRRHRLCHLARQLPGDVALLLDLRLHHHLLHLSRTLYFILVRFKSMSVAFWRGIVGNRHCQVHTRQSTKSDAESSIRLRARCSNSGADLGFFAGPCRDTRLYRVPDHVSFNYIPCLCNNFTRFLLAISINYNVKSLQYGPCYTG